MVIKHDNVVTYCEGLTPIKPHNPLNMLSHDKLKTLNSHYHNAYGHHTCQGGNIP